MEKVNKKSEVVKEEKEMKETSIKKVEVIDPAFSDVSSLPITAETVKKYICPKATDQEIVLFLNQCAMYKLNPFKREIYLIKYSEKDNASTVVGYEVYLKRADRTKMLDGWKAWTEGTPKTSDFKAKIVIKRKDWKDPFEHEVYWDEYAQEKSTGGYTQFWNKKSITMLKKVVIAQGMRLAFPNEFDGFPYIMEEILPDMTVVPDSMDRYFEPPAPEDEKMTHDQKSEIDLLESTLVDKFGYDPYSIWEEIKKRVKGVDVIERLTSDQAEKIKTFLQDTIKYAKKKMEGKKGQVE